LKTHLISLLLCLLFVASCTNTTSNDAPTAAPLCATTTPEISECTSTIAPGASPVTITGTAQFYKRRVRVFPTGPENGAFALGAPTSLPLPIKFAEVRVLNSSGTVVQCGITNSTGSVVAMNGVSPLQIPNTVGNYTVQVLSRTNHTISVGGGKPDFKVYASVKTDICSNALHSVSKVVASPGTGTITLASNDLTAFARESETANAVQGGAFNILNNVISTHEYLGNNTSDAQENSDLTCLSPKMHVYWQAGFNPAQYIYPSEDPSTVSQISFYLRGQNELYINGGKLGNVTTADTDHFDDAVVIHEIGHRIEDACGKMDSPGGTHNGLFRIDPRLAWSEGWGNYFGAHIIRNKIADINPQAQTNLTTPTNYDGWLYYLDTNGYRESGLIQSSDELIRFSLKKSGNNPDAANGADNNCDAGEYCFDQVDSTSNPGEGHFREVSIARSLFKITNTCTGTCAAGSAAYFPKLWQAFEKDTSGINVGMGKSNYPFRSSVRLYNRMTAAFGGSMPADIDNILNNDEAQQRDGNPSYTTGGYLTWPSYGIKLVPSMTPCNLEIRPKSQASLTTNELSDQRFSNHYYYIDPATSLTGITQFYLNTTFVSGSALTFGMRAFPVGYIYPTSPSLYSTTIESSSLSIGNDYILNIRALTTTSSPASPTVYRYSLTTNIGGFLCPSTTF
jgi:hypothetical protein